jgi:hypothetical protein
VRILVTTSLITVSLLTGCSSTDSPGRPEAISAPAPAHENCGTAAGTIRNHLKASEIESVVVQGQCTSAVIRTSLGDDAYETGRQLCESAAEVAYTGDINSVSVVSKSGHELAIGISGMKCLASQ